MDESEKQNILIVDDKLENLLALEAILESPDINLVRATSGEEALWISLKHDFSLIILDVQMPNMDGFEAAELLKQREETENIPIIFITAINKEVKSAFRGYEVGAIDYLIKPINPEVLKSKVGVILRMEKQKKSFKEQTERLHSSIEKLKAKKS